MNADEDRPVDHEGPTSSDGGWVWSRHAGVLLTLLMLPVFGLGLYAYIVSTSSLERVIAHNNMVTSQFAAHLMTHAMEESTERAEAFASGDGFRRSVAAHDVQDVRDRLRTLVESYDTVDRAFVTDSTGVLWSDYPHSPESIGVDFSYRDWFKGVTQTQATYITDPYQRHAEPKPFVVTIATPIRNEEQIVGILGYQYRLDVFSQQLQDIPVANDGRIMLFDANGNIVSHPELDRLSPAYAGYAKAGILAGAMDSLTFDDPVFGEPMIAAVMPVHVEGRKWSVIAAQPMSQAYAPIRELTWEYLAAGAVVLGGALLVMGFIRRQQAALDVARVTAERGAEVARREAADRRSAEQALSESERQYRTLVSKLPSAVYRCANDADWTMHFVSDAIEQITGYPASDLIDNAVRAFASIVHPDDRDAVTEAIDRALAKDDTFTIEYRIVHATGEARWVHEMGQGTRGQDGEIETIEGVITDVTDSRRAQRALAESQRQLQAVLNNTPAVVYIKDTEGRYLLINRRYERLFGVTNDQVHGKTDHDLFPEKIADGVVANDKLVIQSGQTLQCEEVVNDNGDPRTYVSVKFPLFDEDGKLYAVAGISTDITDRKRIEDQLHQTADHLRMFVKHAPVGVAMFDRDMHYICHSDRWLQDYNLPHESLEGLSHYDVFPETPQRWKDIHTRCLGGEVMRADEDFFERADGTVQWLMWEVRPWHDTDGQIGGVIMYAADISDVKRAQAAVEQSERRYRRLVENATDGIFMIDAETGEIVDVNSQAYRQLGYEREEVVGRPVWDIEVAKSERELRGLLAELEIDHPRRVEGEHRHKDGTTFPVDVRLAKLPSSVTDDESDAWVLAFARDMSEWKQIEAELIDARQTAEEASRAKSEFLANMSHEIRTPLNGVIGMSELLADSGLNETQHSYLRMLHGSAESLLGLINDILDLSKIEAGRLELERESFALRDMVGGAMQMLAARAAEKKVELAYDIPSDVPDTLVGDSARLAQVIVNLVGNAIKFTERGEVVVSVTADNCDDGTCLLRFDVRDTGIGIAPEHLERIFEEFSQADASTTKRYGGTGLGLAISRRLVETMDGRLWVDSELGVGSTFHFVARFDVREDPTAGDDSVDNVRGARVLLVDDSRTNRRIIEQLLLSWGMAPTCVASGQEALNAMSEATTAGQPFDVALLDVMMPDIDGFELARRIRSDEHVAHTPLLMLSSAGRSADLQRLDELGVRRYLMKPVKQSDLLNALTDALGREVMSGVALGAAEAPERSLDILLVEDGATNQAVATALLEKMGHRVTVVGNGKQAVAALRGKHDFDLVLMDVQMPEMDGLEATRRIREMERDTDRHIRIIAMTAHAMTGDRERCLDAGMDDYVSKPIRKSLLMEAIERQTRGEPPADDGTPSIITKAAIDESDEPCLYNRTDTLDRTGDDPNLLAEIVRLLCDEASQAKREMRKALRDDNASAMRDVAHRIGGALGLFGAEDATMLAQRIEAAAEDEGITKACAADVERFLDTIERLLPQLHRFVDTEKRRHNGPDDGS